MATFGEALVAGLEAWGIDTVFGIPGVHTIELYRGLAGSRIRHVTPRHEQAAGFMADGYARATGRPAAAFVITGPGLTNIATAMAQAYADSVPMLVVSAVNRRARLGLGAGDLHEMRRQDLVAAQCAGFSLRLSHPEQLAPALERAWAVFEGARPRPAHIEVPLDLFDEPWDGPMPARAAPLARPVPGADALREAARALAAAERPVLVVGGGASDAGEPLRLLAERIAAPVVMTTNARGLLPPDHPLGVPASPSVEAVRGLFADADLVLAAGTEIGPTDFDMYDRAPVRFPGRLLRVEIDPAQMHSGARADLPLLGDAAATLAALADLLPPSGRAPAGAARAARARVAALEALSPRERRSLGLLEILRETAPEAVLVGDSTEAVYVGNLFFAPARPRSWFNAATGFGALGYGLPAAIGAALGARRPVICIAGDGGLQFSLAELGTAVEASVPLVVVVWNNHGYGEIKRSMEASGVVPIGVDLHTPDFLGLARAYGLAAERIVRLDMLGERLHEAFARDRPTLLELPEPVVLGD